MSFMMNTAGDSWLMLLCCAACLLLLIGIALLIAWAARAWSPNQLKVRGIALVVIAGILCLFLLMMQEPRGMNGRMMHKGDMHMSMNDMSMMLRGKTGDAFDEAFLRMMIAHHEGAIDMAQAALEDAGHEEIKTMAREIISAQQREIDQMNRWLQAWGYND